MATAHNSAIKKAVRKIIPVRSSVFERRHNELSQAISEINESLLKASMNQQVFFEENQTRQKSNSEKIEQLEQSLVSLHRTLDELSGILQNDANALHRVESATSEINETIEAIKHRTQHQLNVSYRLEALQKETVWAEIFRQTTSKHSAWLQDTSFSPGRWAVGFPFLYATYRILDEMKPQSILELGLGQSTKMIGQYASYFSSVSHQVVEHDEQWINFWKASNNSIDSTIVHKLDLTFMHRDGISHQIRCYSNFKSTFDNQQFDFISIDAPFGYDMPEIARIDILDLIPNCLKDSFAIIVDDCNRTGEQKMVDALESILKKADIQYAKGLYQGEKITTVIASRNNAFLCTM